MKKQITTLKRQTTLVVLIFCSSLFLTAQVYKTVNLTTGGTLGTVLTTDELNTVTDLTVTTDPGIYLTTADFTTMGAMPVIANLDLSGASAGATANPGGTIPAVFTNKITLKSFKFPVNVRGIAANAFTGSGLTGTFTIPASLNGTANINARVVNCPGITAFAVDAASTTMKAIDGVLFDITGATLALYPGGRPGASYSIPAGTTTVSGGAFSYVTNLTDLNIPASLTVFGNSGVTYVNTATANSNALQNITVDPASVKFCSISGILVDMVNHTFKEFPQGNQTETLVVDGTKVTNVQGRIFQYASKLKSTIFTEGVTSLAYQTFKPNSASTVLAYVELPSTLTTLGNEVFSGCTALKQIVCKAATPPTVGSATFNSYGTTGYFAGVPETSISSYQTSNWIFSIYANGKGFTTAQIVAYRNITAGAKVTCAQTAGIPTKSVSVTAGTPDPGKIFANWTATPTVTFADASSSATTFIMPDADVSIQAVYSGTTGIQEKENVTLAVYPNPASEYVQISGAIGSDYGIYDMNGHLLIQGSDYNGKSISIAHLNNGTYFLKANNKALTFIKK